MCNSSGEALCGHLLRIFCCPCLLICWAYSTAKAAKQTAQDYCSRDSGTQYLQLPQNSSNSSDDYKPIGYYLAGNPRKISEKLEELREHIKSISDKNPALLAYQEKINALIKKVQSADNAWTYRHSQYIENYKICVYCCCLLICKGSAMGCIADEMHRHIKPGEEVNHSIYKEYTALVEPFASFNDDNSVQFFDMEAAARHVENQGSRCCKCRTATPSAGQVSSPAGELSASLLHPSNRESGSDADAGAAIITVPPAAVEQRL